MRSSLGSVGRDMTRKALRTAETEFRFLRVKELKDALLRTFRRLRNQPHDPDFGVISLIGKDEPGCFVDIGANIGQSIDLICMFVPHATIESFEANPGLIAKLKARYASDILVHVHPSDCPISPERSVSSCRHTKGSNMMRWARQTRIMRLDF